jgi:hypothetical protein
MIVFVVLMLAFNLAMFGPPPTNLQFVAVSSLGSFAVMGGVAFWLDRQRMTSFPSRPPSRALPRKQRRGLRTAIGASKSIDLPSGTCRRSGVTGRRVRTGERTARLGTPA